jgi:hypothetical protein
LCTATVLTLQLTQEREVRKTAASQLPWQTCARHRAMRNRPRGCSRSSAVFVPCIECPVEDRLTRQPLCAMFVGCLSGTVFRSR